MKQSSDGIIIRRTMPDPVEQLAQQVGTEWPTIARARQNAQEQLEKLSGALANQGIADTAIVAYGSLARREWTSKSDLDWTLLVDGPARPEQMETMLQLRSAIAAENFEPPSKGGPFGSMASSFELVHRIGGEPDTNRVTTQRVLLLLESVAIPNSESESRRVHERVVRSVLRSYLKQHDVTTDKRVPRFFLNEVVRYWRTIAVDFAAKTREQGDEKWALRLFKLQTSRKLIFSAGLVMALESELTSGPMNREVLLEALVDAASKPPLDLIAEAALSRPEMVSKAVALFNEYERFLALLDDESKRETLTKLTPMTVDGDETWLAAREIRHAFGRAVESFFFDGIYKDAIRAYGVF